MNENSIRSWPEILVSSTQMSRTISVAVKKGLLRKLASRFYTKNLTDLPEMIIWRILWQIVGGYFPGALIADRTALENAPASDGFLCLITALGKDVVCLALFSDHAAVSLLWRKIATL